MELVKFNLPKFIYDFLFSMEEKGRREGTIIRYGYYLEEFCDWLKANQKTDVTFELWKGLTEEDFFTYYTQELITNRSYSKESLMRIESVLTQLYLFYKEQHPEIISPAMTLDKKKLAERHLSKDDFITEADFNQLIRTMDSLEGLTKNQLKCREMLIRRNISIATLFYKYGLMMSEVLAIAMHDLNFGLNFENRRYIRVDNQRIPGLKREVDISLDDAKLIMDYLNDIPLPVRPKHNSSDPLFVAFDFYRLTFRWVYDDDDKVDNGKPKALSRLAIQKMIREEAKRAGLPKGATAQQMRNSAILRDIQKGETDEAIMKKYGLLTSMGLRRYRAYAKEK